MSCRKIDPGKIKHEFSTVGVFLVNVVISVNIFICLGGYVTLTFLHKVHNIIIKHFIKMKI